MALAPNWPAQFRHLLPHAVCLDIETCYWNGPVAVVGIYRPKDGVIEVTQLVRDQTLTAESLRDALAGVQLVITFNGNEHDIPKLRSEFPESLPAHVVSLDLYEVARSLDLGAGLKLLEGQFCIERPDWQRKRRHIAVRLWQLWVNKGMTKALDSLLEYNRQDTANLYFLAEQFVRLTLSRQSQASATT